MKKLIFILFCLSQTIYAQYPVLSTTSLTNPLIDVNFGKHGNYAIDTNNELNQYVGLWRFNQNGILFELQIDKRIKYMSKIEYQTKLWYDYRDCVLLRYKLVKNGIEVYNNLNTSLPIINWDSKGLKYGNSDFLHGKIIDFTRNVYATYDINKLPTVNGQQKIFFNMSEYTYMLLHPIEYYQNSPLPLFNIPINGIEMIKVN